MPLSRPGLDIEPVWIFYVGAKYGEISRAMLRQLGGWLRENSLDINISHHTRVSFEPRICEHTFNQLRII